MACPLTCFDSDLKSPDQIGDGEINEGGVLTRWMENLPSRLHDVPLNCLAIPGSHDSFTYSLDKNGPISPDESKSMQDIAKMFGSMFKDIVFRWSKTQNQSPTDQLNAGIRYLDIRLAPKPKCEGCYVVHGLYGMYIDGILNEINAFLDKHSKEIVFLDFNHFYDMTVEDHAKLMEKIQEIFGQKLCPLIDTETLTLEMMWDSNLQVIAFYHYPAVSENLMFWPGCKIPSPWPDVFSTEKLMQYLEKNYENGKPQDSFFVTQGVLTPDTSYVLSHFMGSLENDLSKKVSRPFIEWVQKKKCGNKKGINICIMDFVNDSVYIPVIVKLNETYS